VSWHAAEAYCEARGATLPTIARWEVAASGNADGTTDAATAQVILDWYGRPDPPVVPPIGRSPANAWGVRDMHGLVWEWVLDFNSVFGDAARFCGNGASGVRDPADVATGLRFEMRSALRGPYTTANLGFRCASS
jgi:formylglycine-generating enzyme required for sulfatase activity